MWRFRFIIYLKHTHTHTPPFIGRFRFIIYLKNTPSFGDRGSSYILNTPPHVAISTHHISRLLIPLPTFYGPQTVARDPGDPRQGQNRNRRGLRLSEDQGTREPGTKGPKEDQGGTKGPRDINTRNLGQPYQGPQTRANDRIKKARALVHKP